MSKRLIVCYDGTWNVPVEAGGAPIDPDSFVSEKGERAETNVMRVYRSISDEASAGGAAAAGRTRQVKWYDQGLGTHWYDKLSGGALGSGLSDNIRQGYKFLSLNYEDGDEIYLFGFSRGAYTARSLAGMIRKCGLLKSDQLANQDPRRGTDPKVVEAYTVYVTGFGGPDSANAKSFRQNFARLVDIHFLGVWDTVGALGVPLSIFQRFNDRLFRFHDTKLSKIVKNAFHAVAIDEHRPEYDVTLWEPDEPRDPNCFEQRWFAGAHSDVGGGYQSKLVSDIPLAWMLQKATGCGLEVDATHLPTPAEANFAAAINDSFAKFLLGDKSKVRERNFRHIKRTQFGNEVIDDSVQQRTSLDATYRPKNKGF